MDQVQNRLELLQQLALQQEYLDDATISEVCAYSVCVPAFVPVAVLMPGCVLWNVVFTDWYCQIRLKCWRRLVYFVLKEDYLTIWNK